MGIEMSILLNWADRHRTARTPSRVVSIETFTPLEHRAGTQPGRTLPFCIGAIPLGPVQGILAGAVAIALLVSA